MFKSLRKGPDKDAPDVSEMVRRLASSERRLWEAETALRDLDMRFRQFVEATGIEIDKLKEDKQ